MRLVSNLSDKERILLEIIRRLRYTMLARMPWNANMTETFGENTSELVHFKSAKGTELKSGDIVLCETSGLHDYTVSVVEQPIGYSECLLREIGSGRTCRMGNESFCVIRGLDGPVMWEGDKYQFYKKVLKAFARADEYTYRFGGLKFNDDGTATVTVREAFGGVSCNRNEESVPFDVTMTWDKKTTIKTIEAALRDGGLGTRKFERRGKEPTP